MAPATLETVIFNITKAEYVDMMNELMSCYGKNCEFPVDVTDEAAAIGESPVGVSGFVVSVKGFTRRLLAANEAGKVGATYYLDDKFSFVPKGLKDKHNCKFAGSIVPAASSHFTLVNTTMQNKKYMEVSIAKISADIYSVALSEDPENNEFINDTLGTINALPAYIFLQRLYALMFSIRPEYVNPIT